MSRRRIAALAAALALAGCDDLLVRPTPQPGGLSLTIRTDALAAAGPAEAFDALDSIRIVAVPVKDIPQGVHLLRAPSLPVDSVLAFSPADSVQVTIEIPHDAMTADVEAWAVGVELRVGSAPVFAGVDGDVAVRRTSGAVAEIEELEAVPDRVVLVTDRDSLTLPADSTRVRATALFVTGDTVPAPAFTFAALDSVLAISADGIPGTVAVRAAFPGTGRVAVALESLEGTLRDTVTIEVRPPPPPPPPPDTAHFAQVVTGGGFACGRLAAAAGGGGRVYCWGDNTSGAYGNGTTLGNNVPVPAAGGQSFVTITAGGGHVCGLTAQGVAVCWGANDRGQLGAGNPGPAPVTAPQPIPGFTFMDISAGDDHTCAVGGDSLLYCWGDNTSGKTGQDSAQLPLVPVPLQVARGGGWRAVAAGHRRTCALSGRDDSLWCMGYDGDGGVGDGPGDATATGLQLVGGGAGSRQWREVTVGDNHTCGVDFNSAQVLCWGRNQLRQLGVSTSPPNDPAIYSLPVVSDVGGDVVELDAGKDHTCAVRVITGALVCWGDGAAGQLGGGNPLNGAAQGAAAASGEFSCGRLLNGATLCWGRNDRGQLGNGTIVDSATPVPVEPPLGQVPIRRYRKGG